MRIPTQATQRNRVSLYKLLENDIEDNGSISKERYNKELEEAEAEFKNGEYISHEEMTRRIKQW